MQRQNRYAALHWLDLAAPPADPGLDLFRRGHLALGPFSDDIANHGQHLGLDRPAGSENRLENLRIVIHQNHP